MICKDIQDAFSSFRTIYLPMIDDKEEERMVIAHEESHLRHFHIFERWAMELLKTFCWFNPFVWIASRYLVESQEMEVDADVLHQGFDAFEIRHGRRTGMDLRLFFTFYEKTSFSDDRTSEDTEFSILADSAYACFGFGLFRVYGEER